MRSFKEICSFITWPGKKSKTLIKSDQFMKYKNICCTRSTAIHYTSNLLGICSFICTFNSAALWTSEWVTSFFFTLYLDITNPRKRVLRILIYVIYKIANWLSLSRFVIRKKNLEQIWGLINIATICQLWALYHSLRFCIHVMIYNIIQ